MGGRWQREIDQATGDYINAVAGGAMTPMPEKLAAARRFRGRIGRFAIEGGLQALEACLAVAPPGHGRDILASWRPAACGHILSVLPLPEAAAILLAATRRVGKGGAFVNGRDLARLDPAVVAELPPFDDPEGFLRGDLARMRFRRPFPEAEAVLDEWLGGSDDLVVEAALKGIARWGRPDLLRKLVAAPPLRPDPNLPRDLQPHDQRPLAAFFLALAGEADGLAALREFAAGRDARAALEAALKLSDLGHPDGIDAVAAQLRRGRALALDATQAYGCRAIVDALLDLVDKKQGVKSSEVADDALRAAREILGADVDPELDPDAAGEAFTPAGRGSAAAQLRTLAERMDPTLCYHGGEPRTLLHLADDLCSPHAGPMHTGAWNLRGITGEDHGYDPDDNLIANLPAIDAWRERAQRPEPLTPGGWAFPGRPI